MYTERRVQHFCSHRNGNGSYGTAKRQRQNGNGMVETRHNCYSELSTLYDCDAIVTVDCPLFTLYKAILHTVGSAVGMVTVVCQSVCLSVLLCVTLCVVAKRYILHQKCVNK